MNDAVWRSMIDVPRDGTVVLILHGQRNDGCTEAQAMRYGGAHGNKGWCLPDWEWYGFEEDEPEGQEERRLLGWLPIPQIPEWAESLSAAIMRTNKARETFHALQADAPLPLA